LSAQRWAMKQLKVTVLKAYGISNTTLLSPTTRNKQRTKKSSLKTYQQKRA
jgi:hypothetical protein